MQRFGSFVLLLCVFTIAATEDAPQGEHQVDDLTPQSLYEQVSELYTETLLNSSPGKRTPTTQRSKGPKKKAIKGGKGLTPTAAGKGQTGGARKLEAKIKAEAKKTKPGKPGKAGKPKAKKEAAVKKKKPHTVDQEWPHAVEAIAGITAPTPAQVADVKAASHNALQRVVNTVIKSRDAIEARDHTAMKNIAAQVTKTRSGIVAITKKEKATGTKNLLDQMGAFSSSLTPKSVESLYDMQTKLYSASLADVTKGKKKAKSIKGGKGKTPTAAGKGLKKKKKSAKKSAKKLEAKIKAEAKPKGGDKAADKADKADKDGGDDDKKEVEVPKVEEEWPSAVKALDDIHAPTPKQVAAVKATSRKGLKDVVGAVVKQRAGVVDAVKTGTQAVADSIEKEKAVIAAAVKKDHATGTKKLFDTIEGFRKLTDTEEDQDQDNSEFSLEEVTSAEFAGHHKSPQQACACCHHFKPKAECYSMKCGDGSGEFCWSPSSRGIHWGWGAVGKKSYRAGADECSAHDKAQQCQLPCVAKGTC